MFICLYIQNYYAQYKDMYYVNQLYLKLNIHFL